MVTGDVKLIGSWASVFVMRARIALNLKSISYEFLQETYGTKSELLLKSNPVHKKMPVLIHADKPVCESNIIVQYIDEAWSSYGPSILPSHPYDRAIARFWAAYVDDKVSFSTSTARVCSVTNTTCIMLKIIISCPQDLAGFGLIRLIICS